MARDNRTSGGAPGHRPGDDHSTGARAAGDGGQKKGGGLAKMLLGLLVLLVVVALLLLLLKGCSDDDKKKDSPGAGAKSKSTLKASGKALLPVPASGLASLKGQQATGKALKVVKVNGNEGFSVGKLGRDQVYIEWGGDVGKNEASRFRPMTGQKVNLAGPVEAAGPNVVRKLKLDPVEARLVKSQGAYVNADRVVRSR